MYKYLVFSGLNVLWRYCEDTVWMLLRCFLYAYRNPPRSCEFSTLAYEREFVNPPGAIFSHEIRSAYIHYEITRRDIMYTY